MKIAGQLIEYNSHEFKVLFDGLFPAMSLLATRILRDEDRGRDIAQEAFVKLWERDSEDFASENALRAYLYVLIKNACLSEIRKEKNFKRTSIEDGLFVQEQEFLNEVLREETYRLLRDAIKDLSPQGQRVVTLALRGYTNQDISEELEVSINTVKTLKKRAYKSLREKLGSQFVVLLLTELIQFF
ncbi:RNA polymerase sigma factor [Marinifilum fragile]|uniref:RNA polymerase sigma factor n=1 Tax=Marinifilum fragile TaxID=570161 RepID=UPI0006D1F2A9|nr:sigma-70 family RNA polymerase sigma factor [Marinifilum fragile]